MDFGGPQTTSTSSSQDMCNIFFDKEMQFCLVCQQAIGHDTNASQHILEETHKKNMKKLFEFCVSDPFCDSMDPRYSDVVNNSVLYISHALTTNEAVNNSVLNISHILTKDSCCDKTFKCLLCTKAVSSAKDPVEIKRDLVLHLNVERDTHLDFMKRDCSWVYCLDNCSSFIMFYESIVYCSLCEEVINYADNLMLHAAVGHLQTSRHRIKLESNAIVDLKSINGSDKVLNLFKVTNNEMTIFKDNISNVSGNNLMSSTNLSDELDAIVTADLELNGTVGLESVDSLDKKFSEMINLKNNLSDVSGNSLMSSANSSDDETIELNSIEVTGNMVDENLSDVCINDSEESGCEYVVDMLEGDPLTCPECGETIEIYNNNADFSLRLHSQKHIDLSIVNKSVDCEYQDETDYVCPVCMQTIPIFNKNLELSIACHFEENKHDQGFCTTEILNESEVLDKVLAKLPQEYKVHHTFFKLDGNEILCKLCSCVLLNSSNISLACELITQHISDPYHSDQFNISSQQLMLTVVSYNKDTVSDPQIVPLQNSLFESLVNKNIHIRNNKDFIEIQRYLYLCTICQKHVSYSPKEKILERNFLLHFQLSCHKNNLINKRKELKLQISTSAHGKDKQQGSSLTSSLCDETMFKEVLSKIGKDSRFLDVKYIKFKSGKFLCRVCNVSISASVCGSPVKEHLLGSKHKKQTNLEQLYGVENERAQKLLDKRAKFSNLVESNLTHINVIRGHFYCYLCKESIIVTSKIKKLTEHLVSISHRKKFYKDAHLKSKD